MGTCSWMSNDEGEEENEECQTRRRLAEFETPLESCFDQKKMRKNEKK